MALNSSILLHCHRTHPWHTSVPSFQPTHRQAVMASGFLSKNSFFKIITVFGMRGQETYFETAIFILRSAFVYIVFRVRELSKNAFTRTLYALSFLVIIVVVIMQGV